MVSQYRHRRTSNPATAFPTPLEPGEIAVNSANRQLALGDAAAGTIGQPLPLLAVRYFDARARYALGDFVINSGVMYRANTTVTPAAFNATQWDYVAGGITTSPFVELAGDTMTGPLVLPAAAPTLATHAVNKAYVDARVQTKAAVVMSPTPPTGLNDGDLWMENDTGVLYVQYNDGNTTQWIIAAPQPSSDQFVQRAGSTMSGDLTISKTDAALLLDQPFISNDINYSRVGFTVQGSLRWRISGAWGTEGSGNVGNNFSIDRCDNNGLAVNSPLTIMRDTGNVYMEAGVFTPSYFNAGYSGAGGTYYFGSGFSKYLTYDGTNFQFGGGNVILPHSYLHVGIGGTDAYQANIYLNGGTAAGGGGHITFLKNNASKWYAGPRSSIEGGTSDDLSFYSAATGSALVLEHISKNASFGGAVYAQSFNVGNSQLLPTSLELGSTSVAGTTFIDFHSSGTATDLDGRISCTGNAALANAQLGYTANNHSFSGNVNTNSSITAVGLIEGQSGVAGGQGFRCRPGAAGPYGGNSFNIQHIPGVQQIWIDSTNMGQIAYVSDYRTKKDVVDLPSTWDTVKALRPIKYTQAQFSPPSHVDFVKEQLAKDSEIVPPEHLFVADDIERWGFIAHELQETLVESASTGVKDSPDSIQAPNPFTLIAALTRALQEAMTRIEALEATGAR